MYFGLELYNSINILRMKGLPAVDDVMVKMASKKGGDVGEVVLEKDWQWVTNFVFCMRYVGDIVGTVSELKHRSNE